MSTPLLHATNISHQFDYELFSNVDFSLDAASSAAILGRSGCGKSTLLHIFSTFMQPVTGSVKLLGHDLYTLKESRIESLRRHELGIIFQFHYLFRGMSALENIEIATLLSGEEIDRELLQRLEIDTLMEQKVSELSGGQQQRVSIARVLSKKPRVIFADEPTGNLDKETAQLVMKILLEYVRDNDAALLLVTHDEEMAGLCDEIHRLENKTLARIK